MITNGGGVTDASRCASLSRELEVDVRVAFPRFPICPLSVRVTELCLVARKLQVTPTQLVQSHTPLRASLREKYENEGVLVIGGRGQSGRAVAESKVPVPTHLIDRRHSS